LPRRGCDGDPTPDPFADTVWNANEFKRNPGVSGLTLKTVEAGRSPIAGIPVQLINTAGQVVGSAETDEDGFYMIVYKHKGKAALYMVRMNSPYSGYGFITLKGNGFEEANFTCMSKVRAQDPE